MAADLYGLISIHVPRVEDDSTMFYCLVCFSISIHVPRVEDDDLFRNLPRFFGLFQSTSPVWRTTGRVERYGLYLENFNPRPPCGGRHRDNVSSRGSIRISIHVPRVEDDMNNSKDILKEIISIHVPCVEDDLVQSNET